MLQIHARSLAEHGGIEGVREPGLVESALASAANTFHYGGGDLFDIAASYAFHLAQSQAFLDGNKRTAVVAAMVFLARNGVYAQPAKWELYLAMIDIAEKNKTKSDLAEIFRRSASENS
ncbi:MAG: type II toxin-antitoxin system death-on-curing family toxin [Akkermansiaceae bacterium]|nr:type II toxin-antitoxin system death-on-curing family toxin [Verrucomicrobiales bacterium]